MTMISILGVAIGVAALILVLSVMGGFEADLKRKMLTGRPHLEILGKEAGLGFSLKKYPLSLFKKIFPEATGVQPFTKAEVVIKRRKMMMPITLYGIDPESDGKLWGFGGSMIEGELSTIGKKHRILTFDENESDKFSGIVLGEELAMQVGADLGDELTLLSPQFGAVGSILGGGAFARRYVVSGKFRSAVFTYDMKWAVVSLEEGRRYLPEFDESLVTENVVTGVGINIREPMNAMELKTRINDFKDLQLQTWQEINKPLLFALKLEKFSMGAILMLIVLVAAFSISGTMMMTVFHKRAQICLLRSLGMSRGDIIKLFMTHGLIIGTIGILAGLVLGVVGCTSLFYFKFIPLPEGVYYLTKMPVKFLPTDYLVICLCAWVLITLAAIYPAYTAAKQDPGVGLRYE